MPTKITELNLSQDELRFVEKYLETMDYASRVADAVQAANGDWHYVDEKLGATSKAADKLHQILTEEIPDPDFPEETNRVLVKAFNRREANLARADFAGGPTQLVPPGFADPGKIRAAIAASGWYYSLIRAAHPVEQIEDRFAVVRERALAERNEYFRREAVGI